MTRFVAGALSLLIVSLVALLIWPERSYQPFQPSEAYFSAAQAYDLPPQPDDWRQQVWTAADGTVLRWGETGNRDSAKATLVWIPGYTATLDMYGEQIDKLARRGFHVIGVDMRGQGLSQRARPEQPEKLFIDDFAQYSDDLARFVQEVAPEGRAVIPVGMSFGGHVAFRTALERPELFDALFLVAPALQPNLGENAGATVALMRVMRFLGKNHRYLPGQGDWQLRSEDLSVAGPEYCASNPARLHARDVVFARSPEQRVGGVTVQWGAELMESAAWVQDRDRIAGLAVPVRMMLADYEVFVVNEINREVCDALADCEATLLPDTAHCLTQESDAVLDTMFDALDALAEELRP